MNTIKEANNGNFGSNIVETIHGAMRCICIRNMLVCIIRSGICAG